jgi:hypothetical protein
MRPLICLVCFACATVAGCAATTQYRPDERPTAGPQKPTASCSSSGSGGVAACAATIAVSAVIHSVQE